MIEAIKRLVAAVEAIPEEVEGWMPDALTDALIDARQAIAEAEKQEPAIDPCKEGTCDCCWKHLDEQEPMAIPQFRKKDCADWYDGYADHQDGKGPYEERVLYTHSQPEPVAIDNQDLTIAYMSGFHDGKKAQPKREPLTLEQLREHWQVARVLDMTDAEIDFADYVLIARDVEALHGIKGEA